MNKQPSRIGLYLVLIIALVAGYFYLNNQVVSQSSYTQKQLEQALEDNKVVDATIQQNREVPTGAVIVDTTDSGQRKVYVTDVNEAISLLNKYDIDVTTQDVPGECISDNFASCSSHRGPCDLSDHDDEPSDVSRRRWKCQDDEFWKEPRENVIPG